MVKPFLSAILEYKQTLVYENREYYLSIQQKKLRVRYPHLFKQSISRSNRINLIAEIKKASPSQGEIRHDFDPVAIAQIYQTHKAAAISVLTEDKYFLGKPEYIREISANVNLPLLTKDFIIDEGQIYEACQYGANAILLIVALLDQNQLQYLFGVARSLGLDCLVEVHNKEELDRAVNVGADIIGINNRDLNTLEVDLNTCIDLIPQIPVGTVIVAESGFRSAGEIQILKALGAHAVLIGETFMRAPDIGKKVEEMMYGCTD